VSIRFTGYEFLEPNDPLGPRQFIVAKLFAPPRDASFVGRRRSIVNLEEAIREQTRALQTLVGS
jgi:hypothetical protein